MMNMRFLICLGLALCGTGVGAYAQGADGQWSLEECLEYAQEQSISVQLAKLEVYTQQVNLRQSEAGRYPSVSANLTPSVSFGRTIDPTQYTFTDQRFDAFSGSINASWVLFDGFRVKRTIQQNQLGLATSQEQLAQQAYDLAMSVALNYLTVLLQTELLEGAQLQRQSTLEQRNRTNKLVQAGSLAQGELAQLDAQLATEELNVVRQQNELTLAKVRFQQLLLLDIQQPFDLEKPNINAPASDFALPNLESIYANAMEVQPGMRAADLSVQQAEIGVEVAQSNFYPTLLLGANINTGWSSTRQLQSVVNVMDTANFIINGQEVEVVSEQPRVTSQPFPFFNQLEDNLSYGVNMRLSVPIYQNRSARSSVERAEIGVKQAQLQATQVQQGIVQDIQQAYIDAQNALLTYQATERQVEALNLSYFNLDRQFELGATNAVDLLVAKNNLNSAKLDLVRAKYDFVFRIKILDYLQGKPIVLE